MPKGFLVLALTTFSDQAVEAMEPVKGAPRDAGVRPGEGVAVDGRLFAGIRMRARRPRSRGTTNKRRRSMRNRSSLPYPFTWANWERTLLRNRARSLERSII